MTAQLFFVLASLTSGVLALRSWYRVAHPNLSMRIAPFLHGAVPQDFYSQVVQTFSESVFVKHPRTPWGSTHAVSQLLRHSGVASDIRAFRYKQLAFISVATGVVFTWITMRAFVHKPMGVLLAGVCISIAVLLGGWLAVWQLQETARKRSENADAVLPIFLELMAFTVGAGEPVVAAMERATDEISGPFAQAVKDMSLRIQAGESFADALHHLNQQFDSRSLNRAVRTLDIAMDRGTPLAEVLRAQANDARATYARELMILAGKKETAMLLPVVFLILPMIVAVAIYPGLIALKVL